MDLTNGRGADIVVECAGSVVTARESIAVARKGGTIVVTGICFDWVHLPVSDIVLKGLTVKGSICFSVGEFASALDLLKNKKIDVETKAGLIVPEIIEEENSKAKMIKVDMGAAIFELEKVPVKSENAECLDELLELDGTSYLMADTP